MICLNNWKFSKKKISCIRLNCFCTWRKATANTLGNSFNFLTGHSFLFLIEKKGGKVLVSLKKSTLLLSSYSKQKWIWKIFKKGGQTSDSKIYSNPRRLCKADRKSAWPPLPFQFGPSEKPYFGGYLSSVAFIPFFTNVFSIRVLIHVRDKSEYCDPKRIFKKISETTFFLISKRY